MNIDENVKNIKNDIYDINDEMKNVAENQFRTRNEINNLIERTQKLANEMVTQTVPINKLDNIDIELHSLNQHISLLADKDISLKTKPFSPLTTEEIILSSIAGLISVAIDVIFVGTPEVVKIYKGGEDFNGSILTSVIRKLGEGKDGKGLPVLNWLSDHCHVPYDISLSPGILTPNNHRIRSLGHDPFFGLFFAIADIIMGTTTCIDNSGHIRILINDRSYPMYQKFLSVFYYVGHIFSDICTARGIPIPGFFLTQFFTNNGSDKSIAKIAEDMYKNGYDMRHMISMSVPVYIKKMVIASYLFMSKREQKKPVFSFADGEYDKLADRVKKERMIFVSDSIAVGGNLVKFFAPPNCGNPCGLNAVQWFEFIRNGINIMQIELQPHNAEKIIVRRREIDRKWDELLQNVND